MTVVVVKFTPPVLVPECFWCFQSSEATWSGIPFAKELEQLRLWDGEIGNVWPCRYCHSFDIFYGPIIVFTTIPASCLFPGFLYGFSLWHFNCFLYPLVLVSEGIWIYTLILLLPSHASIYMSPVFFFSCIMCYKLCNMVDNTVFFYYGIRYYIMFIFVNMSS